MSPGRFEDEGGSRLGLGDRSRFLDRPIKLLGFDPEVLSSILCNASLALDDFSGFRRGGDFGVGWIGVPKSPC